LLVKRLLISKADNFDKLANIEVLPEEEISIFVKLYFSLKDIKVLMLIYKNINKRSNIKIK
jgi:hypothetical protein